MMNWRALFDLLVANLIYRRAERHLPCAPEDICTRLKGLS